MKHLAINLKSSSNNELKTVIKDLKEQLTQIYKVLLYVYISLSLVFALLALQPFVAGSDLTRDTVSVGDNAVYVGIISDLGLFVWTATVAICLFSAYLLADNKNKQQEVGFLVVTAFFIFVLLLDDRLMIHEEVIEANEYIYALYGLGMLLYLYRYQKIMLQSRYAYFVLALMFLGMSAFIDTACDLFISAGKHKSVLETTETVTGTSGNTVKDLEYLLEDGLKFFGIVGWLIYCLSFCTQQLKSSDRIPSNSEASADGPA